MNRSFFFEDQVYDWGRFQKTGPHTRTKITPMLSPLPLVPWVSLQCVIVVFPSHTHLLFNYKSYYLNLDKSDNQSPIMLTSTHLDQLNFKF